MFRLINPARKRLSLFGFLFIRTIFTIQGTHMGFCAIAADETQLQLFVRYSSSVSADRTQLNRGNKLQLLYIYHQQFGADGTRNAATAQSPVR